MRTYGCSGRHQMSLPEGGLPNPTPSPPPADLPTPLPPVMWSVMHAGRPTPPPMLVMWPVMRAGKPPPPPPAPLWTEWLMDASENITFPCDR